MIKEYRKHEAERAKLGIPALPLTAAQTEALCELLLNPPKGEESFLLNLFKERIPPGVDPAAYEKAEFLSKILDGQHSCPLISKEEAIHILGTMIGGYNVAVLIKALKDSDLCMLAAEALSMITLVYDHFDEVLELSKTNAAAKAVITAWAEARWFTSRPEMPAEFRVRVFKVDGETNTDDLSPAGDAFTRPDIPLHALAMGKARFPGGVDEIIQWRSEGVNVAYVGDVVGTGSSRKSACNSVLWHTGQDIPAVPNKRRDAVIIGGSIAPIFFNTAQDSGALPLVMDVTKLQHGMDITIDTKTGKVFHGDEVLTTFKISPRTVPDEFRAGGRIPLIIGRSLTAKTRAALGLEPLTLFKEAVKPVHKENQGYTLAQKMVGKACGVDGILPGTACEPVMSTVLSQDTTGPMTADEMTELACLKFQAPLVMQSFCHTAAYPKPADVKMHKALPLYFSDRGGLALKPGDGVCHSWVNRMLVPDEVGTGGDSHTRFPMGISFPAGSGLVAFAAALGFMPLDMPESVLVKFKGSLNPGITLRDAVNAIPYFAIQKGLLTVPKKNKINVFNGRILEIEGLPDITVEQAFELTDAAAERSAAAATIKLSKQTITEYLKSNLALMERMLKDGYQAADALINRIEAVKKWMEKPELMSADDNAEYAEIIEIDLADIKEPILACPNDPDDVRLLSEVQGDKVHDVFLGSCMLNIGHFRAAAKIWEGGTYNPDIRTWVCPPTKMDQEQLRAEAHYSTFSKIGSRIEIPGCSLCMGNQARVPDEVTVYSTSTRNFNNRMGRGAKVYLGSAELGAVVALKGELPTPEEYLTMYKEKIQPNMEEIYDYLQFDEMDGYGVPV
ncbi:MAG: bifunctional aconitate hydratase 2/2-methylisocitrate dehydratase [Acidobacteria bacterium]|nr:MAG: bifunctional aconitate hydratase 2/2-methylisocitrate dehydratase [Acidobacteriota bacterium]